MIPRSVKLDDDLSVRVTSASELLGCSRDEFVALAVQAVLDLPHAEEDLIGRIKTAQ